jgi:hypothetical protein
MDETAQRTDAEGPLMATFLSDPDGSLPAQPAPFPAGAPLMTLNDWAALASAPTRPVGTQVSVRATPVSAVGNHADHMFVEYDDGQNQLIARGEPSKTGSQFLPGLLSGTNRVAAEVTPEALSKDYRAPYRPIASTFLPGMTSDQAAEAARRHAQGIGLGGNAYGPLTNSNSYAADVAEPLLGWRPGDGRTWGYKSHLSDAAAPGIDFSGPLNPENLTPIIRNPPF